MATVGVNWAGIVVTLNESETKSLETAANVMAAATALITQAAIPAGGPAAAVIGGVLGAYFKLQNTVVSAVDQGYGVYLTMPWAVFAIGWLWFADAALLLLIIPTPVLGPPPQAAPSQLLPNQDWTGGPYYGSIGTYFADVNGDGKADAIAVNNDTVTVRLSTGTSFGPNQDWTGGPYYGTAGTFFADVTGNGKADAIVVNNTTITVRLSTGTSFGPNQDWTPAGWVQFPFTGVLGIFFADVNGDGKADAIVVSDTTVTVYPSNGTSFGPGQDWTGGPYYGTRGTYFADVNGDGKADAIVVNDTTVTVRLSTGTSFGPNQDWTGGPYYGTRGTYFADTTGDGKADAIAVNDSTITVRRSTGSNFGPNLDLSGGPFYGTRGTYFAKVVGPGPVAAIVVSEDTVTVRPSQPIVIVKAN
jgi:hypothetical protein